MSRLRQRLVTVIEQQPALALFLFALLLGPALVGPVRAGWVPPGFVQAGALSASLAGVALTAVTGGAAAVRALLARGIVWRVGYRWWIIVLLLPLVPAVGARVGAAYVTGSTVDWVAMASLHRVVPSLLMLTLLAGLGEEFGWRGFALSRLRARHGLLTAALIVGAYHALWHIPLFFLPGELYAMLAAQLGFPAAFAGYACLVVALSLQLAWVFEGTKGSVLLVAVYHGAINAWSGHATIDQAGLSGQLAFDVCHMALSTVIVFIGRRSST